MKICQIADLENLAVEGRTQIALSIKSYLERKNFLFVDSPTEADLIHFHSSGIANSFKAAKLKKQSGKPVLYSFYSISKTEPIRHLTDHLLQRFYLYKRKTKFLLSYSAIFPLKLRGIKLKELDLVITPSTFVKDQLFSNTKVIRLGVDTKRFQPFEDKDGQEGQESPSATIKVGFIGHPNVYKGVLDFAKASRKFSEGYQPYVYATLLSDKIKRNLLKINPKLRIQGLLEDIREAYHNLEIIVLPYRSYLGGVANPLVLLEAMACGKAIITTDFKHLQEIVQDSAVVIKRRSSSAIIKAVESLRNQSLRETLGKKARAIILKEFDQDQMFQEYLKIYKNLAKPRE